MKIYLILFFSLLMTGCDESEPGEEVVLPSELTFQVEITPGSRQVTVDATAKNANYYTVYFGEKSPDVPVKSTDGKASYTYTQNGTFTIKVQAHATDAAFVSDTKPVTVSQNTSTGGVSIPTEGYSTPTSYAGMNLVWNDEFSGTSLNTADWTFEIGTGTNGWGNNELQYYRQENTTFQDGHMIITAKKENFGDREYTSSRIITKDKKTFQYGRIDIRAALPKGQGIWPALWMLGNNISSVNWPACGELDIMEMIGGQNREKTVFGTLHWDNGGSHACTCDKPGHTLSSGTFADKFHVFSVVWNENKITWYVDDVQFNQIDISPAGLSEFRNKFFFIFNVAVGGNWPGAPDGTSTYPQHMIVDYIRVFQPQ
jgi:beta-glucanase (GH16 family)